ncbi:MAG: methyltransferase [Mariprofundales bacterium]
MEGSVQQLLPGGESLVQTTQGSVLVADVLPGETVRILPQQRHRGVMRGRLRSIVQASPDRCTPSCSVAAECGGCSMQHVSSAAQQSIKLDWLREAYRSVIRKETLVGWLPDTPDVTLRRRVRWHVATQGDVVILGFRQRRSHRLVNAADCMVVEPPLISLHHRLWDALSQDDLPPLKSITATLLYDGIHLVLESGATVSNAPPFLEIEGVPIQWWLQHEKTLVPWNRPVQSLHDRLPAVDGGEIDIAIPPLGFVQASSVANRALVRWLIAEAKDAKRVVDLFCGHGNLSLSLARDGRHIVGAEVDRDAVAQANRSAQDLGLAAEYHTADLFSDFDPAPFVAADVLILDPPRKGARRVAAMMGRLLPRKLIMIHCDPASGGRDAATVADQGYRLQSLYGLDMFSKSGHIESVSMWCKVIY